MKTNDEVKDHFKNAKEVKCLSDGKIYDITKLVSHPIIEIGGGYWIWVYKKGIKLSKGNGQFAEIISTKEPMQEYGEALNQFLQDLAKPDVYEWRWVWLGLNGSLHVSNNYYTSKKEVKEHTFSVFKIISKIKKTKRLKK
jgi:hypothetical protein